ncbi:hypothetical protein TraAM80_05795 [Trypanosoma rangeli]|uniref:Retrotransposon hot spot protein N-terminal domain-containing protein n=1 Tax=Trypanosoma rangeli TaxID=5698 RepID=A0A3R7MJ54_TRYRA|nr:uncharacterized protein TraAM80_05795 [Trypanosoma rangeli]RNF03447.1 hypothetical protein TraAM80_05795 [Trypanosoma rangeli]|eukprot:RNF03447.1 hypothetical protein TraAM80_05795 [Trypanosoma rangeli]
MQRGTYVESGHPAEPLRMWVVGAASSRPQILWSESGSEADVTPRFDQIEEEEETCGVGLEFIVLRSAFAWPCKFLFCQITRMYLCGGRWCVCWGGARGEGCVGGGEAQCGEWRGRGKLQEFSRFS